MHNLYELALQNFYPKHILGQHLIITIIIYLCTVANILFTFLGYVHLTLNQIMSDILPKSNELLIR